MPLRTRSLKTEGLSGEFYKPGVFSFNEALLQGEGGEGVINYSVVDSMTKFLKYIVLIANVCRISHRSLNYAFVD